MKFRSFINSQSGINHAMKQMLTLDVTKGYLFTLEEHEEPIPKGERMPQTPEYFQRIMDTAEEIIFERNAEISKLKSKVNDLENKLRSKKLRRSIEVKEGRGFVEGWLNGQRD